MSEDLEPGMYDITTWDGCQQNETIFDLTEVQARVLVASFKRHGITHKARKVKDREAP